MNIEEFWTLKRLSRRKGCWRSFSKNVELSLLSVASNRASPWLRHFGNFTVYFMPVQQSRFNCSKINYAWIYQITPCCGLCLKRGSYIISRLCFLGKVHYLLSLTNCSTMFSTMACFDIQHYIATAANTWVYPAMSLWNWMKMKQRFLRFALALWLYGH